MIFLFTHPMMELLIRTRFFGQGHKLSGLDPEHLGAENALVYAGRGRVVARGESAAARETEEAAEGASIAERRRAARLAAEQAESSAGASQDASQSAGEAATQEEEN